MLNKNVTNFISCDSQYNDADIVVFGSPFDGTTSFRPGTRFGPMAIRNDSYGIETYSPYQDKDLSDLNIFDSGDIEFPFGNTRKVLDMIKERTKSILDDNKMPVMIGGEHLVTLGCFEAIYEKYPDINVLHFDAHTDLREEYLGEKLSHASIIKRIWDIIGDNKIHQHGIRSGEKFEFEFAKKHTYLTKFNFNNLDKSIDILQGKPVYFTLDLDVLDPSIFCGTGTPEAGGVSFMELLNAILKLSKLNIVGCDINELSPVYDQSGVSTAVACKIIREILLVIGGK